MADDLLTMEMTNNLWRCNSRQEILKQKKSYQHLTQNETEENLCQNIIGHAGERTGTFQYFVPILDALRTDNYLANRRALLLLKEHKNQN